MTSSEISEQPHETAMGVAGTDASSGDSAAQCFARDDASGADAHVSMLKEVDFKWLMAGQGWWIDTTRFHSDRSYAARYLRVALASPSSTLRDCAASLRALHR